jgi:hypothetical protein
VNESNKPQFIALLTDALAFYKQNVTEFSVTVWWQACQPFDFQQVAKAFTRHATDPERGQFPPKPADIIRVLQGTTTDRAAVAWGRVHEAMGSIGAYTDVVFDDPAIHAVVEDLGGWPKLCRTELKDLGYTQHRFTEAYRAYVGRGEFEYPKRLMGDRSPDAEYERKGLPPPKPAVIGDREQARLVYQRGGGAKAQVTTMSLEQLAAPITRRIEGPKE